MRIRKCTENVVYITFKRISKNHRNAATIPPCEIELYQRFLRTYFIAKTWINADKNIPLQIETSDEDNEDSEPFALKPTDFDGFLMKIISVSSTGL